MGMKINTELPLPAYLKAKYPLPEELVKLKAERDEEIRSIFEGKSDKFVVIVGPCSADREDSVLQKMDLKVRSLPRMQRLTCVISCCVTVHISRSLRLNGETGRESVQDSRSMSRFM